MGDVDPVPGQGVSNDDGHGVGVDKDLPPAGEIHHTAG